MFFFKLKIYFVIIYVFELSFLNFDYFFVILLKLVNLNILNFYRYSNYV